MTPPRSPRPYVALVPVCVGVLVAAADQTVVATVLPQVMLDLKVQVTELDRASWTITGYLLGYVAAMPLMGRLSDVYGHRRLFALSILLFMVASVGVALASDLWVLVATRVIQAVGAGAMVPIGIAIAGDVFPADRRGMPLGVLGAAAEAGGVIGPLWGVLFLRLVDWRWVFWANLPLGAAVLLGLAAWVPPGPRHPARVDYLGGGLLAASLVALALGLSRAGGPDGLMAVYMAVSIAALALFVRRQAHAADPLLPLATFRRWAFTAANATHLLVGGALILGMVTIPLMADTALGQTPMEGGLRLARMTAALPVGALIGGWACQRLDYRVPTVAGLALAALGYAFMSGWGVDVAEPAMTVHLAITGLGFGLLIAPIALAATNSVRTEDRGAAASLVTASRIVGMTVGLATMAAWGSDRFSGLVAGMQLPLQRPGETAAQVQERVAQFEAGLAGAGVTLFSDFFRAAMVVCLLALVPAVLMAWGPSKRPD